jgi:hypothetical protein
MKLLHLAVGWASMGLFAVAAAWGAWCWRRARTSIWFWRLLRAGQLVVVIEILIGGLLVALGHRVPELHLVYGALPVLVSLIAEQLRISAAQMVLDSRGLESAQAVGELEEADQRAIVVAILQREIGVMALAALVIAVLLFRAASTG